MDFNEENKDVIRIVTFLVLLAIACVIGLGIWKIGDLVRYALGVSTCP